MAGEPDIGATIAALKNVTMPPGLPGRRFVLDMQGRDPASLTDKQVNYVLDLAWKFRRQMPARLVPPPPAGKDAYKPRQPRRPVRLFARSAETCPQWAVWAGPGSRWQNPWALRNVRTMQAVHQVYQMIYRPPDVGNTGRLKYARPPSQSEKREVVTLLFEHWIVGWANAAPSIVEIAEKAMNYQLPLDPEPSDLHQPVPQPPTIPEIRRELAGKSLAGPEKGGNCHIDVLMLVAAGQLP